MTKVKVFVTYKEKHKILKSDIITPIQTGRAIADEIFGGMIGDDTGDNISNRNSQYSELSAQYWVWKNYEKVNNPEYVGFMHYRRHFIFDDNFKIDYSSRWMPGAEIYKIQYFDKMCYDNLSDEKILTKITDKYDCYVYKPYDINKFINNDLYMREHYIATIPGAKRYIWDTFYNAVKSLYPQYEDILNRFTYGHVIYPCNMFIMRRELFEEYSRFCFDVLDKVYNEIDFRDFHKDRMRFLGYLGEYLLTMFIMILQERNAKINYLDGYFLENPDKHYRNQYKNLCSQKHKKKLINYEDDSPYIVNINFCGIRFRITNKQSVYYYLKKHDIVLQQLTAKVTELQNEILRYRENTEIHK